MDKRAATILAVVRAIPSGETLSYGEVARRAGLPRRARWVAKLLATAADESLPWHRVLRADGRIAFAEGSAGFDEQLRRLRAEGVQVADGRMCRKMPRPRDDLDALLWGPR